MMILWILAYLGGVLTILSPCILPVLPFVLSRADDPFRKSGLPLLAGMAATFTVVSTFAVVGGSWVVHANEWGRWLALVLLSIFALTLLSSRLAEAVSRPFMRLGGTLHQTQSQERGIAHSFVLGAATGLLWAPCAGPILGLILTSAALHGANVSTSFLLFGYALGAATSLALALLAGSRVLQGLRRYLGVDEWVRRIIGCAVLVGVLAIALGWDRSTLARLSRFQTGSTEQALIHMLHPESAPSAAGEAAGIDQLPELNGAVAWINSGPLTLDTLKGKVVLIDFWTYSCINCLRSLPYIEAWSRKYKDSGLVVIGVHTPEFAFEKNPANVEQAVRDLGITYPVAIDSRYAIWNAFGNQYWPAHYLIDATGKIRHHHFGEGDYDESEQMIQNLLAESSAKPIPTGYVRVRADGVEAPSFGQALGSPETYIGYSRAVNQISLPPVKPDQEAVYASPASIELNQWSLAGRWKVQAENATLVHAPGKITFRFHARDLHLVLGPGALAKPISFIVRLDGQPPKIDHGVDIDESGRGIIKEQRLYQLIRQERESAIQDRTFEIEFLNPGAQAFAFTFG
jgi:cytochrome c biogenesis protein CcdA/thiol-disulfide isomerase/thioredoxin